jgi:hypothetical protein
MPNQSLQSAVHNITVIPVYCVKEAGGGEGFVQELPLLPLSPL